MHLTSHDKALKYSNVLGTDFCPAKEPVLPSHGDNSEGSFQFSRVNRDVWIGQEKLERVFTFVNIVQRFCEVVRRQKCVVL